MASGCWLAVAGWVADGDGLVARDRWGRWMVGGASSSLLL